MSLCENPFPFPAEAPSTPPLHKVPEKAGCPPSPIPGDPLSNMNFLNASSLDAVLIHSFCSSIGTLDQVPSQYGLLNFQYQTSYNQALLSQFVLNFEARRFSLHTRSPERVGPIQTFLPKTQGLNQPEILQTLARAFSKFSKVDLAAGSFIIPPLNTESSKELGTP
jgi:hypothetical protein